MIREKLKVILETVFASKARNQAIHSSQFKVAAPKVNLLQLLSISAIIFYMSFQNQ